MLSFRIAPIVVNDEHDLEKALITFVLSANRVGRNRILGSFAATTTSMGRVARKPDSTHFVS